MANVLVSAFVGVIASLIGAAAVWLFENQRDKQTKRRDICIGYLIEAYRKFESICHRPPLEHEDAKTIESALADIQLFGTLTQVELARKFVDEYSGNKNADVEALLAELRKNLRNELGLAPSQNHTFFLRITFNKNDKK